MSIIRSLVVASVLTGVNLGLFSGTAEAYGPPINPSPYDICEPFEVTRGIWHLRCHTQDNPYTFFYIDHNGQYYMM